VCEISNQNGETSLYLRFAFNKKENNNLVGKFIANELNIVRIPIKLVNRQINTIYANNDKLTDYSKQIWHQRLGHFYHEDLVNYLNLHNVKEIQCMDCKIFKLRRPHNGKPPKASGILEIVHSDLMGPINKSVTGKSYILTFLDEYSRKSWIHLVEKKFEVPNSIIQFFKFIKAKFDYNIKFYKTDNSKKFRNKNVESYCAKNGIQKIYSPPYNPQNNGMAERLNYTITDFAKTMIHWSKLGVEFWDFAVIYANFLYIINPHKEISNLIPIEVFFNKKVDLKYI